MIQLQSVLLPQKEICQVTELYYHQNNSRLDFDGYFNLFYIEKRKKYTEIEDLFLSIYLQGYRELRIVHNGNDVETIVLDPSIFRNYQIPFPYKKYSSGVFWFALLKEENSQVNQISKGFYETSPITRFSNDYCVPNIAIDICTYRREEYVLRSLKLLKENIIDNASLDVYNHIFVYLIDNANTLNSLPAVEKECIGWGNHICIIPNKNTGGTGGFTRGMLEIIKDKVKKHITHILLMDDDAILEPDSIVRIYGFISTLREEWKDITLGGMMMRQEYPHILYYAGEQWKDGVILNPVLNYDLRNRDACTTPYLTATTYEYEKYAAWGCCCYSLEVVRDDNLPLPLFFHYDDIEYGSRNYKTGLVVLNGVTFWHRSPEMMFQQINCYYDLRNALIQIALHQKERKITLAWRMIIRSMAVSLFLMEYQKSELIQKAIHDFLKGPLWLFEQDATKLHAKLQTMTLHMEPYDHLISKLSMQERQNIQAQVDDYMQNMTIQNIARNKHRKVKSPWLHYLTLNGWLLPAKRKEIQVFFPTNKYFDCFRQKNILLYEPGSNKAALIQKNYFQFFKICLIDFVLIVHTAIKLKHVLDDYQKNIKHITNRKAWEKYLNL